MEWEKKKDLFFSSRHLQIPTHWENPESFPGKDKIESEPRICAG